jgi:drug/metabolite transporter (DMT)-like permease
VCLIFGAEAHASGRAAVVGAAAVLGGSICVAFAYSWLKSRGPRLPPIVLVARQSAAAVIPLACVGLVVEGRPLAGSWTLQAWVALLYLSLCASVLAFWLNYWLLARMDASAMLMMGIAEVPIAVAPGGIVFGERLPSGTLAGGLCVLLGVRLDLLVRRATGAS